MALKSKTYQFKGMNKDLSNINASEDFAYEIRNMKITANEDNTLLSISSVKGPKSTGHSLEGTPIGDIVVDDSWVVFCAGSLEISNSNNIIIKAENIHDIPVPESDLNIRDIVNVTYDYIHVVTTDSSGINVKKFYGNLGFSTNNPIEAISFVENDEVKKVYWTDGKNQLRFINIEREEGEITPEDINFIPNITVANKETLKISRDSSLGIFPAGTVLYVFTYFNYYGQQSNIFKISTMFYNSINGIGLNAEETSSNSYNIELSELSDSYKYVRIYSIIKTSQNSVPEVKIVADVKIEDNEILYIDTNTHGQIIDPTDLFYVGGKQIIAETMTLKDNTLFLGNITQLQKTVSKDIIDKFKSCEIKYEMSTSETSVNKTITEVKDNDYYFKDYQLKRTSSQITTFKSNEWYRFGVQLQDKSGNWSDPIFICDKGNDKTIESLANDSLKNHTHALVYAKSSIDKNFVKTLLDNGYIKIRPVIVYPELLDRNVLCQGYVCPTVFNVGERLDKNTWVQSSWFARPNIDRYNPTENDGEEENGALLEFRPYAYIGGLYTRHLELLGADRLSYYNSNTGFGPWSNDTIDSEHRHLFFVDSSIVTFHSPEIEFDDSLKNIDFSKFKLNIVGTIPLTSFLGDIDIITSTPVKGEYSEDGATLIKPKINVGFNKRISSKANYSIYGHRILCSGAFYNDYYYFDKNQKHNLPTYEDNKFAYYDYYSLNESLIGVMGVLIFPFHCSGKLLSENGEYGRLQYKKLSNVRYSYGNNYMDNEDIKTIPIKDAKCFYSQDVVPLRLETAFDGTVNYNGNIDTVIVNKILSSNGSVQLGTLRYLSPQVRSNFYLSYFFGMKNMTSEEVNKIKSMAEHGSIQKDPIVMRYKSTPHLVISLDKGENESKDKQWVLPIPEDFQIPWDSSDLFWRKNVKLCCDTISQLIYGYLLLAELVRKDFNEDTIFGGKSTLAIENNKWTIAGEEEVLKDNNSCTVNYIEGDTYYLRYDNLKTYPWSLEEENAITEVISFMVETRINIDGNYSKNRADAAHFHIFPYNFNLINKGYTLKNDFFTYYRQTSDRKEIFKYPNMITWSKTKTSGENIDTWLNINLSSTLNLNGNNGRITSLLNHNNNIIAFQDKAINNILYNESTPISTETGVPIELANSGKVTGNRIINDQIGCSNKWSIAKTSSGIYFIDSYSNDLYRYGEILENLSVLKGFSSYIRNIDGIGNTWNPNTLNPFIKKGIKTCYDLINKEVLFTIDSNSEVLSYSEQLQSFMSFYDFKALHMAFLKFGNFILGNPKITVKPVSTPLYYYQEGKYNYLNEAQRPYYIEFISNPDPLNDKIFNALEFRSDSYDDKYILQHDKTFNRLTVSNEYQYNLVPLVYSSYGISPLKKKFRIWKALIPRDGKHPQDRIRNTWTKIKLESTRDNDNLNTILHDITVHYSV